MKRVILFIYVGVALAFVLLTGHSMAQSIVEIEKQKAATEKEIKDTRTELGANEKKVNQSLAELRKIEDAISVSQKEVETVKGQLSEINDKILSLEGSIAAGEKDLASLREEYLKAVKKMRVARKRNSGLAFLFASKSFNEARRRMRYMKEFSEWKDRRSGEISDKVNSLQAQRNQLTQARNDANVALQREKTAQAKLNRQKSTQQQAVSELKANSETLRSKLAKRQAEARKLSSQISALIAEEQAKSAREAEAKRKAAEEKRLAEEKKKAKEQQLLKEQERRKEEMALAEQSKAAKEVKKTDIKKEDSNVKNKESAVKSEYAEARKRKVRSKTAQEAESSTKPSESKKETSVAVASGFGDMKGRLPKPVSGSFKIISAFGVHPISPELPDIIDENLGIDAHVANGATAMAVYEGDVIKVYDRTNTPGFRNIIVVKHGDYITVYANMETLNVKTGQHVTQGQSLGTVGSDFDDPSKGLIHFEVWKNQTHLDPATWIKI